MVNMGEVGTSRPCFSYVTVESHEIASSRNYDPNIYHGQDAARTQSLQSSSLSIENRLVSLPSKPTCGHDAGDSTFLSPRWRPDLYL